MTGAFLFGSGCAGSELQAAQRGSWVLRWGARRGLHGCAAAALLHASISGHESHPSSHVCFAAGRPGGAGSSSIWCAGGGARRWRTRRRWVVACAPRLACHARCVRLRRRPRSQKSAQEAPSVRALAPAAAGVGGSDDRPSQEDKHQQVRPAPRGRVQAGTAAGRAAAAAAAAMPATAAFNDRGQVQSFLLGRRAFLPASAQRGAAAAGAAVTPCSLTPLQARAFQQESADARGAGRVVWPLRSPRAAAAPSPPGCGCGVLRLAAWDLQAGGHARAGRVDGRFVPRCPSTTRPLGQLLFF